MDERVRMLEIPSEDGAVISPGPQCVPVGAEGESVHTSCVTGVDGIALAASDVPDHDEAVIGSGRQLGSVRAEGQADEPLPMAGQLLAALPTRHVEQADDDSRR